ncbi:Dabb family protein [Gluconacetobacter entanii]|uniref:Dabb family protein n=1 Tax=Gluconacetobacter entanii TaxID=108528 RepID=UPI001FC94059|nr:Dabb family protein [Gluconacetobacter entanii]
MTVRYWRTMAGPAAGTAVAGRFPHLVLGAVLSVAVPVMGTIPQAHADAPDASVAPTPTAATGPAAQPASTAPATVPATATPAPAAPAAPATSVATPQPTAAPPPPASVVPTGPLPSGGPDAPELGEEARAVRLQAAQIGLRAFTAPDFHPGKVRHIVLMRFLPTITDAQRAEVVRRFMALGQVSRRDNGQQVIASIETGVQMSGEGVDQGFEQGFIVTFNSEGDRNYYVGKPVVSDPAYFDHAHEAFKKFAAPYIIGVLVFDYALPSRQVQHTRRAAVTRPGMTQQQG